MYESKEGRYSKLVSIAVALLFAIGCSEPGNGPGERGGPDASCEASDACSRAEQTELETHYYAGGERVSVELSLQRLALTTRSEVSAEKVRSFADPFGLSIAREGTGIFVLETEVPRERANLADLARRLRDASADFVDDVALIVDEPPPLLMTDRIVVRFEPGVSRERIDEMNASHGVEILRPYPYAENEFVLRTTDESGADPLAVANQYHASDRTQYAHPDFLIPVERTRTTFSDPLYSKQWHHRNTTNSRSGSIPNSVRDADVDTPEAWDITTGSSQVAVAVVEPDGFDHDHEDLKPNRYENPGETGPGTRSGKDDDQNGYTDDVHGLDFADGDHDPHPVSGSYNTSFNKDPNHGTAVAGIAIAEGGNGKGGAGVCPDCEFIPIRLTEGTCLHQYCFHSADVANAFKWASKHGDVITNSWQAACTCAVGVNYCTSAKCSVSSVSSTVQTAVDQVSKSGTIVVWAGGNRQTKKYCTGGGHASFDNILAVSGSSRADQKNIFQTGFAFGDCIDLLAPAERLWSTDRMGAAGYNTNSSGNYTTKVNATSGATPIVAGVAGLVRSVDAQASAREVRRILRDTADKIQPAHGGYSSVTGKSTPLVTKKSGAKNKCTPSMCKQSPTKGKCEPWMCDPTHGWGRVNAYEAVRVADQGADVFLRDNRLDWGNTERPSGTKFTAPKRKFVPWWQSADIKVDAPDSSGSYQSTPKNSADFEALTNEDPKSKGRTNKSNRVYVRLRNRGPKTAEDVEVELYYAFAGTSLPRFQKLNQIGQVKKVGKLPYSGATVAGSSKDPAEIVRFDWKAPNPKTNKPSPNHFCLVAVVTSKRDDRTSLSGPVAKIVPRDNNVTLDNLEVNGALQATSLEKFYIRNPLERPIDTTIQIDAPDGWKTTLDGMDVGEFDHLDQGVERVLTLKIDPPKGASGDVRVWQEVRRPGEANLILGGMTYRFDPETHEGN